MIEFVSATRLSQTEFWSKAALGIFLERIGGLKQLAGSIAFSNTRPLPDIFNARIDNAGDDDILVFLHDDVWIDDFFVMDRLRGGLKMFDIIGVAGNRGSFPGQISWFPPGPNYPADHSEYLSGSVAHGQLPFGKVSYYGPVGAECALLDGLFLAVRKRTLRERALRFDPQFDFHFYDVDFCRAARACGLRLGTWPVSLTHQSTGSQGYSSPSWQANRQRYLAKWGS